MRRIRKFIINCVPLGILKLLAPKICSVDNMSDGSTWYRLYDSKKPLTGADVLIRRTNSNYNKTEK